MCFCVRVLREWRKRVRCVEAWKRLQGVVAGSCLMWNPSILVKLVANGHMGCPKAVLWASLAVVGPLSGCETSLAVPSASLTRLRGAPGRPLVSPFEIKAARLATLLGHLVVGSTCPPIRSRGRDRSPPSFGFIIRVG